MDETSKTKSIWGNFEKSILKGRGIDIGCGPDPVFPDVRRFDLNDGDANEITKYVNEHFDFVYSSHCLEHMNEPRKALLEWWQLVKPGGYILFIIPDEDLYEQGVFPSRFNPDHKATFTITKHKSWSPVSINVMDLANSLPDSKLVSIVLHDQGYDRSLLRHGRSGIPNSLFNFLFRAYRAIKRRTGFDIPLIENFVSQGSALDQTLRHNALAQIQCIVQKLDNI